MISWNKTTASGAIAMPALFLIPGFGLYLPNALIVVLSVCAFVNFLDSLVKRQLPRITSVFPWLLLGLAAWAACTTFWALDTKIALQGAGELMGLAIILILLFPACQALSVTERKRAIAAYLAGLLVATAMLIVDFVSGVQLAAWFRDYDITDVLQQELAQRSLNRGVSLLALYAPISLLAAWHGPVVILRWLGLASTLIATTICLNWGKDAVWLSLLAALLMGGLSVLPRHLGRNLLISGFALLLAASPMLTQLIPPAPQTIWEQFRHWPPSLQHRLFIWSFTGEHIAQHPLSGWGMNSAKIIPEGDQDYTVGSGEGQLQWRALPLHPHNAILQWWLELGLPGSVLAGGMVVSVILAIWRLNGRFSRIAAAACVGPAFTMSLLSFGAWQSWWLAGLLIVAWLIKILDPLDQA